MKLEKKIAEILEKLATYEEYKKLHPKTKKKPSDPMFNHKEKELDIERVHLNKPKEEPKEKELDIERVHLNKPKEK